MSNRKVKGLLKGLRYISHIFENEKEQEIQIGCPTDVKHVAHIGWDGPSVNSPSWMNEYKTASGVASAPMTLTADAQSKAQDNNVKWVSEDSTRRRSSRSVNSQTQGRDLPELPKSSRRQTNSNTTDSPTREKTRQSRKTSSNRQSSNLKDCSSDGSKQEVMSNDSQELLLDGSSQAQNIPKKTRRKKSKDKDKDNNSTSSSAGSKLRSKTQQTLDPNLDYESPTSKSSRNKPSSFEENENYERGMSGVVS